jgi:hypothetical protein
MDRVSIVHGPDGSSSSSRRRILLGDGLTNDHLQPPRRHPRLGIASVARCLKVAGVDNEPTRSAARAQGLVYPQAVHGRRRVPAAR